MALTMDIARRIKRILSSAELSSRLFTWRAYDSPKSSLRRKKLLRKARALNRRVPRSVIEIAPAQYDTLIRTSAKFNESVSEVTKSYDKLMKAVGKFMRTHNLHVKAQLAP